MCPMSELASESIDTGQAERSEARLTAATTKEEQQ